MKLILDCDPGHDDAIALLLALASPEVELLGVTTVHGNQTLEKTTVERAEAARVRRPHRRSGRGRRRAAAPPRAVRRRLRARRERDGRPGAAAAERASPVEQHAIDFIAETVLASPEPVTLVPTGPLTNIALFLALHPEAAERVERIVLMGGAIGEGNVTPAAEFNIWADPEAADRVFSSGLDVTMIGLDVTHKALFGPGRPGRAPPAGARRARWSPSCSPSTAASTARSYGWDGSPIHDAVALAHAFRPGSASRRSAPASAWTATASSAAGGRTSTCAAGSGWEPNAEVAVDIDAAAFVELLVERIASLG